MGFFSDIFSKVKLGNLLDTVRKSEWIKDKPVLNAVLNNPLVDDYFQRNLNQDHKADASFEKKIAVASAKMASQYLGFDKEKSIQVAEKAADFVRDMRRVYQYQQEKISEKEFNQHKEVSWWGKIKGVAKAAWEVGKEKVKDFVAEKGLSWLLKKAVKFIPNPLVQVATHVWDLIPEDTKGKIKEGAKKLAKKAVEAIPKVAEKVWEGTKTVAKTVTKVVEKSIEKAKEIGRKVKDIAKPVVEVAKTVIKTGLKKVINIGKAVASYLGL